MKISTRNTIKVLVLLALVFIAISLERKKIRKSKSKIGEEEKKKIQEYLALYDGGSMKISIHWEFHNFISDLKKPLHKKSQDYEDLDNILNGINPRNLVRKIVPTWKSDIKPIRTFVPQGYMGVYDKTNAQNEWYLSTSGLATCVGIQFSTPSFLFLAHADEPKLNQQIDLEIANRINSIAEAYDEVKQGKIEVSLIHSCAGISQILANKIRAGFEKVLGAENCQIEDICGSEVAINVLNEKKIFEYGEELKITPNGLDWGKLNNNDKTVYWKFEGDRITKVGNKKRKLF